MEKVYDEKMDVRLSEEFKRLKDECYLDHAGATLYSEVQIRKVSDELCDKIFGNPHSLGLHSKNCRDIVDQVRNRILRYFHTDQTKYSLIFTSGATDAIRLVCENFDWHNANDVAFSNDNPGINNYSNECSAFIYTQSNHTSILGARQLAAERGVKSFCINYDESFSLLDKNITKWENHFSRNSLFAYPAQCNFSGRKYPMEWISNVQKGALNRYRELDGNRQSRWFVLLDAATYCSTNGLDLSLVTPDFVCLSFYKIFGYPTGLGALLVRNSSAYVLRKSYFGGGTVEISLAGQNFHRFRSELHERFEDGTISFLSIISLNHGFDTLDRLNLNMNLISRHVFNVAKYAYSCMEALTHWNGKKLVKFYADSDYENISQQGGIINFNLLRSNGQYIGYAEVLHIANLHNIHLRTGCFCNSGACQRHLGLTDETLKAHFKAGHVCGDEKDLIDGRPTGSVRISFGYMTTSDNIDAFIHMISDSFLERSQLTNESHRKVGDDITGVQTIVLKKIWFYPIKSCGGVEVKNWQINSKGLEYDREWMIVTHNGVCLTQKQEPRMSLITPSLDLEKKIMILNFRGVDDPTTIPIEIGESDDEDYNICQGKICGDIISGFDCGDGVALWLDRYLCRNGLRLVKQNSNHLRRRKKAQNSNVDIANLSLSNQAQYLLINDQSVKWLMRRMEPEDDIDLNTFAHRFRANFLVGGADEFTETSWSLLSIGSTQFRVEGPCGRCHMICIDQHTGEKNRKPLVTLSRELKGKLNFGVYLSHLPFAEKRVIRVGDGISILAAT